MSQMQEPMTEYIARLAAKLGFQNVHFDEERQVAVFPGSGKVVPTPPELKKVQNHAEFIAATCGTLAFNFKAHFQITVDETGKKSRGSKDVLLHFTGGKGYEPFMLVSNEPVVMAKLDDGLKSGKKKGTWSGFVRNYDTLKAYDQKPGLKTEDKTFPNGSAAVLSH